MKLSPAQRKMLQHAEKGEDLTTGLRGRSAFGGATRTIASLKKRGFIDRDYKITEAGKAALHGDQS